MQWPMKKVYDTLKGNERNSRSQGFETLFWVILAITSLITSLSTFKLKEIWKLGLTKIEKHERDNNKPFRNKDT